jgi:hypothetical protein
MPSDVLVRVCATLSRRQVEYFQLIGLSYETLHRISRWYKRLLICAIQGRTINAALLEVFQTCTASNC